MAWNDLPLSDKARMMKLAVSSGITDLRTIEEVYNKFAEGGKIHIKPENRGKFTALKERIGRSASWFKAHGTPAQKKMATFALNARKWHHAYGGPLIYPFSNREIPDVRYADGGVINSLYDYVSMPYQSVPTIPYAPNDFSGIKTTGNRKYDESYVSYINDKLANKGVNKTKREALIANIIEESGGDPYADSKTGFKGLLQWSKNRYWPEENLLPQEYNKPYTELDKQINYIYNTTNTPDTRNSWNKGYQTDINKVGRAIDQYNNYHDATSLEDTMKAITYGYVRPAGKDNSYKNRSKVAKQLKNKINR